MGLLEKVTLSDGTVTGEKNISKYFYNNAGVQIKMYTGMSSENDSTYLTTNYEYDSWLRPVRTTDSTGYNSGTITYDLNGNVLTSTDANGNVTTNTYDALNRVLTSNTVNSSDSSKNVSKSYTYDSMGRITQTVSNGLTKTCIYDSLGRIYTESEYDNNGYSVFRGYFYEGISQYVSQELTGQYHLLLYSDKTYEYDDEMRVVKVKESGEETVSYTYDANGNKKSETLANGVVSTYTYNKANRITNIVNKSGNTTISSYEYSYYLDGSDACKVRSENGIIETTEYEYDGLKRLTEESVSSQNNTTDTYSYEYDDYGNRSKMTATGSENYVTEYSYSNAQGNYTALLQKEVKTVEGEENPLDLSSNIKQTVYTYDANGNQITKTAEGKTETNTYDGLNQLIGFTDGETTASYKYNAIGLRYEKTVDDQTINHVWDGNQQIVANVIDNQFYEADCYIRGTNLVAKYNYCNGTKSEYAYYTQNAHGDVVNLTNAEGAVVKSYKYDAFGVEINPDTGDVNVFRFCGEYFDTETGTVYLRARYYQASIGRFISRDSYAGKIEDPLSLNRYTYCHNNPILGYDPSGHKIQLKGSNDDKETVLTEMQKLTDHKLAYDKKGYVYISEYAYAYNPFLTFLGRKYPRSLHDAKYLSGNQLIESMLESKKTTSIIVDRDLYNGHTDLIDEENAGNILAGSDTVITFNPDFSPEMYVQKPHSKYLELEASDPYIVLAHEMIHADRAMKGHFKQKGTYTNSFFDKYRNFLWWTNEVYRTETIALEEAETVGFSGSFDINENMIRKEHGIKLRGRYTIDK